MIEILKNHPFFKNKQIESCELLEKQGYCNENYTVVVDGVKYIVRKLLRTDIDRKLEWRVLQLAFHASITAEPLVFDKEYGFMIFEFLEGVHQSCVDENALKLLVQTLQKLHNISIDAHPIELQTDTRSIEKYPKEYVLCHNDLNPQNIFFSDDVKLIDFEYAGINDKYFDLACVCVEFRLNETMQEIFLASYFNNSAFNIEKLNAYKVLYQAVCEEWFRSIEMP